MSTVKYLLLPSNDGCFDDESLLIEKIAQSSLILWCEAKVKQPLCCISFICSYMCTFPIKVRHVKVIEFLAVIEMAQCEANADFQRDHLDYGIV